MPVQRIELVPGNPPTAKPNSQGLSKRAADTVKWHSNSSNWSVDFEGDSPFAGHHFSPSNPDSGPIRADANNGQYTYSITVDGAQADPMIIINP